MSITRAAAALVLSAVCTAAHAGAVSGPTQVQVVNPTTQPVPVKQQGPVQVSSVLPRRFRISLVMRANGIDYGMADGNLPNWVDGKIVVLEDAAGLCNLPVGETMGSIGITARVGTLEAWDIQGSTRTGDSSVTPTSQVQDFVAVFPVYQGLSSGTTAVYFFPPSPVNLRLTTPFVGGSFRRASSTGNAFCFVTINARFEDPAP